MKAIRVDPVKFVVLGALVAIAATGCTNNSSASPAASSSAPASLASSTTPSAPARSSVPAASASSTTPAAPASSSTPRASASPAPAGGVQNLAVTAGVRQELLTAYVNYRNIPAADVDPSTRGTLYYAYDPSTGTYWAMATYASVPSDPMSVQVGFQDGGAEGLYKKTGSGPWKVSQGGEPTLCGELQWFPASVMRAWSLPTAPLTGMQC